MARSRKLTPVLPPRMNLIQSPTPLHRLNRLSEELGLDVWIKRDDLTGFAMGGNKGRKLEYLIADVLAQKAEVVVTCGAAQSNFIRQLGAACSICSVHCAAAVMAMPFDIQAPEGAAIEEGGNLVLDELLGVDLRFHPNGTWDHLYVLAEQLAVEFEREGTRTYRLPVGGSSPLGAYAFIKAAEELTESFDFIVFASSSGSTHTGLQTAFRDTGTRILGIACDPEPEIAEDFAELSSGLNGMDPTFPKLDAGDYQLNFDYVGPGYGIPSAEGNAAIRLLARTEGIFLDPIYSGKAFAGLLDLAERGQISGKVLFWHTGGTPGLFVH